VSSAIRFVHLDTGSGKEESETLRFPLVGGGKGWAAPGFVTEVDVDTRNREKNINGICTATE
jgi:hypothetical protein